MTSTRSTIVLGAHIRNRGRIILGEEKPKQSIEELLEGIKRLKKINKELLSRIIRVGNRKLQSQQMAKFKDNFSFDYDDLVRKEFRKRFPGRVRKIKSEILLKEPKIKFFPDLWDRKADQIIFPDVLEKQDQYVFTQETSQIDPDTGRYKRKTDGGTHISLHDNENYLLGQGNSIKEIISEENGRYNVLMSDLIKILLEDLSEKEDTAIRMAYGLEPYEDMHTFKDIAAELGVANRTASKLVRRSLEKLLKKVIKIKMKD